MKVVVTTSGIGDVVARPDPLSTGRWVVTSRMGPVTIALPVTRANIASWLRRCREVTHLRVEVTRG
jgi:hypothetical protein